MGNEFDPYREALVVEAETVWPVEFDDWEYSARRRVEERLHAQPEQAAELTYERRHSGFCRMITVTPTDLERVG